MLVSPSPRCKDSLDIPTTRKKTSLWLKNISSSIPTSHVYLSTNSHQYSRIQIIIGSIKSTRSTPWSSNGRMWIQVWSEWASLRTTSILSKCIMNPGMFTSIQGGLAQDGQSSQGIEGGQSAINSWCLKAPQSINENHQQTQSQELFPEYHRLALLSRDRHKDETIDRFVADKISQWRGEESVFKEHLSPPNTNRRSEFGEGESQDPSRVSISTYVTSHTTWYRCQPARIRVFHVVAIRSITIDEYPGWDDCQWPNELPLYNASIHVIGSAHGCLGV